MADKLKPCRSCDHRIARGAKTCPSCGIRNPAASRAEAGLTAASHAIFGLAFLILVAVLVVGCIAAVVF